MIVWSGYGFILVLCWMMILTLEMVFGWNSDRWPLLNVYEWLILAIISYGLNWLLQGRSKENSLFGFSPSAWPVVCAVIALLIWVKMNNRL